VHTTAQKCKDLKSADVTLFLPEETLTVDKQVSPCSFSPAHSVMLAANT